VRAFAFSPWLDSRAFWTTAFSRQDIHRVRLRYWVKVEDASEHITADNNVDTIVPGQRHNHPGGAYGFRIERNGKVLVICTDVEHGEQIDPRVVELSRGADLLVHDAQYSAEELRTHRGWGHSSFDQAIQVAEMAGLNISS